MIYSPSNDVSIKDLSSGSVHHMDPDLGFADDDITILIPMVWDLIDEDYASCDVL